jgi:hypothetical protein
MLDCEVFRSAGPASGIPTVSWNAVEGLVAVIAGALAGSISLAGFGIVSFIEVASGGVALADVSRCKRPTTRTERKACADGNTQDIHGKGLELIPVMF